VKVRTRRVWQKRFIFFMPAFQARYTVGAHRRNSAIYVLSPLLGDCLWIVQIDIFRPYEPSQAWLGAMHDPPLPAMASESLQGRIFPCERVARMGLSLKKIASPWLLATPFCQVHPEIIDPSLTHYSLSFLQPEILWDPGAMTVFGAADLIRFSRL
jgi:hypothetical protein